MDPDVLSCCGKRVSAVRLGADWIISGQDIADIRAWSHFLTRCSLTGTFVFQLEPCGTPSSYKDLCRFRRGGQTLQPPKGWDFEMEMIHPAEQEVINQTTKVAHSHISHKSLASKNRAAF